MGYNNVNLSIPHQKPSFLWEQIYLQLLSLLLTPFVFQRSASQHAVKNKIIINKHNNIIVFMKDLKGPL